MITGSITGHNLGPGVRGHTLESCKQLCDANTACKSIDFKPSDGNCILGNCQIGDGQCVNDNDANYQYSSCLVPMRGRERGGREGRERERERAKKHDWLDLYP